MISFIFQKNQSTSAVTGCIGGLMVVGKVREIEGDPQRVFLAAPQVRNVKCLN